MSTTHYLLRFDDICPTMNWSVWLEIESILIQHKIRPLLAVVPDNHDPGLQVDSAAADFWERVREWHERDWSIALHGYQHRYVTQNAGLVGLRKRSEFAGLPRDQQLEKLRRGVEIFEREGMTPRVWIAPGHSFDAITVSLLPDFGMSIICDGYFRFPFVCRSGVTWVPQQLSYLRVVPTGVWTVCYHHNHWTASHVRRFAQDVEHYCANISSLEDVLASTTPCECKSSEWTCTHPRLSAWLIRAHLKAWSWRSAARKQWQDAELPAVQVLR